MNRYTLYSNSRVPVFPGASWTGPIDRSTLFESQRLNTELHCSGSSMNCPFCGRAGALPLPDHRRAAAVHLAACSEEIRHAVRMLDGGVALHTVRPGNNDDADVGVDGLIFHVEHEPEDPRGLGAANRDLRVFRLTIEASEDSVLEQVPVPWGIGDVGSGRGWRLWGPDGIERTCLVPAISGNFGGKAPPMIARGQRCLWASPVELGDVFDWRRDGDAEDDFSGFLVGFLDSERIPVEPITMVKPARELP
jgi:hypothetical protein